MDHHRSDVRVLHVVASTDRRGAETAAVHLAKELEAYGLNGEVVALAPGQQGGLDLPVLGPTRYSAATLRGLREAAKEASVVLAYGSSTLPAVAAATVGIQTPFVYRSIGDPAAWVTTPARRIRVAAAARRAAALVAFWRGAAVTWHRMLGIRPERIWVIPNGSDPHLFVPPDAAARQEARAALGLPRDGAIAMCLGALSPEKRVDLAIKAVAAMDGVTLAVVGAGPEHDALAALSGGLPGGRVRLLAATDRPEQALAAADVLVLPSDTEGHPAVAIQAGLTGLPVVATRVGGVADIVLDGVTGVLIDRGDDRSLRAGIEECLARGQELGAAARAHCADKFAMERIARSWSALLQSVIKT